MAFAFDNDSYFFGNFFTKEKPKDSTPDNNALLLRLAYSLDDKLWYSIGGTRDINIVNDAILNASDVYVTGQEVHSDVVSWLIEKNNQRVLDGKTPIFMYLSGYIDGIHHQTPYMSWFEQTAKVYKKALLLDELDQLFAGEKPYVFNALLGRIKPHRTILHKMLASENGITTLIPELSGDLDQYVDKPGAFIWEGDPAQLRSKNQTIESVKFNGYNVSISKIIPTGVYAKSRWCVIAETNFENGHIFLTEKTAKPIIAKKPFVIAGNPSTLKFLRELGFQTFDSVIDESYDNEQNFRKRTQMVANEILKLCKLSKSKLDYIDQAIEHIVEHNRNHLYSKNWTDVFYNEVYPRLP